MLFVAKSLLVFLSAAIVVSCLLGITWIWLSCENIPNLITATPGLTFDYIIVGAGTSGSVLAHELSEHRNISVLIIEAGHTFNPISKVPLLATILQKSKYDWKFLSTSQKHSSRGLINQIQFHPRGKGLGGTSQLNYMMHFNGNQKDFELWNTMGIKGWNMQTGKKRKPTDSCSKIIQSKSFGRDLNQPHSMRNEICYQSENRRKQIDETNEIWTLPFNYSRLSEAFVEASSSIEAEQLDFRLAQYNIKNGRRWSVYEKFLRPCFERKNLKILSNTLVKKIYIKGHDANAVIVQNFNNPDEQLKISSRNEIILAAGSYQGPQLLQISGIGPKHILDQIGVKQIYNAINVGENLHDHFYLPLFVSINVSATVTTHKILNLKEIFKYLGTGKGHFSNFGVIGVVTPKDDIFGVTIFGTGAINEDAFMAISNFKQEDFRSLFPLYYNASQEGFIMLSMCYQTLSRGYVKAKTSNMEDMPHIDPNYLDNQNDVDCIIRGVRTSVKIISSEPFRRLNSTIYWPKIKSCSNYGPFSRDFRINEPSDRYLKCLIQTVGLTGHHPGGTCSMGSSSESVLDTKLRVRGINRLRVVDASVLPTPISGTPNSVLISMAKHAAKLILRKD